MNLKKSGEFSLTLEQIVLITLAVAIVVFVVAMILGLDFTFGMG